MRTLEDRPRGERDRLLAMLSGTAGGAGGGFVLPGLTGLLGPHTPLWGWLCFAAAGMLAGCVAAVLCVLAGTRGFGGVLLTLCLGVLAGLLATLPPTLVLQDWARGLNGLGRS